MKIIKSNFQVLSKIDMKNIIGGMRDGGATATCSNGTKITCNGDNCYAADYNHSNQGIAGSCGCATDLPGGDWISDVKQC